MNDESWVKLKNYKGDFCYLPVVDIHIVVECQLGSSHHAHITLTQAKWSEADPQRALKLGYNKSNIDRDVSIFYFGFDVNSNFPFEFNHDFKVADKNVVIQDGEALN